MHTFSERFFKARGPITFGEIASLVSAELVGGDVNLQITGMMSMELASRSDLTFLANHKYSKELKHSNAGVCLIKKEDLQAVPEGMAALVVSNPYYAWAQLLEMFFAEQDANYNLVFDAATGAYISENADIGRDTRILPGAVIEEGVNIGNDCHISAHTYIGKHVEIGNNVFIGHGATIQYAKIGHNCVIHPGVRIGQDGFGFASDEEQIIKIKHIGTVIIGNNVEIGANTCVDRGAIHSTSIDDDTKIDNLVQIAHNVKIGKKCFIAGQTGIAGSTIVRNGVMIGGQAGINGHIELKDGSAIAGASVVTRDVGAGQRVGGHPALDIMQWHRQTAMMQKMSNNN